MGRGMKSESML